MEKQRFTDFYLSLMIAAATDDNVKRVRYEKQKSTKQELVTLHFDKGYTKTVNVTGDSLVGIAYDVLKAVMS